MAFLFNSTRCDRSDLILARAEASRLRRLEEAHVREAQQMVARFFGLTDRTPAR